MTTMIHPNLHLQNQEVQSSTSTQFDTMEQVQNKVQPYITNLPSSINNATANTYETISALSNKVYVTKDTPTLRYLYALITRIAEAVDAHIFLRTQKTDDDQHKALQNVDQIKTWTYRKGQANLFAGLVYPALSLLGALVGGPISEVLKIGQNFLQLGSRGFENYADTKTKGPQFNEASFLQQAGSDKQAAEKLRSLASGLHQLFLQILQQQQEQIRATKS